MFYHQPHNSVGNYSYNMFIYRNINYKPHFHKNIEFVYVLEGAVYCTAGEKAAQLEKGEMALFLSNEVHSLQSVGDSRCWVGVFSEDFVSAFARKAQGKTGSDLAFRCEQQIRTFLETYLLLEEQPSIYLLKAALYAVCGEYERQIRLIDRTGKSDLLMGAITDFIKANYKNRITLQDVAEHLGYNYHYLSKRFNKAFAVSFTDFLNDFRLDTALRLLDQTDMDIAQVAMESGFQSLRSFNSIFKARIGKTPTSYRLPLKRLKNG